MLQDPICHMSYATSEVCLIDPVSDTVVDSIPVGLRPSGAVIGPDRLSLYVTYFGVDYVSVFDTITHQQVAQIALPISNMEGMSIISDQHRLYVLDSKTAQCIVIDPERNEISSAGSLCELLVNKSTIDVQEPEYPLPLGDLDQKTVQEGTESPNPSLNDFSISTLLAENSLNELEQQPQESSLPFELPEISIPENSEGLPTNFDPKSLLSFQPDLLPSSSLGAVPDLGLNEGTPLNAPALAGILNTNPPQRRLRGIQRKALLLQLRGRIKRLKLPPEMEKKLEQELISATKHIKAFISNVRLCVNLKLIPFHQAAPIIRIAKKILN